MGVVPTLAIGTPSPATDTRVAGCQIPDTTGTVYIASSTQWGALRALESFSQLVQWAPRGSITYSVPNVPITISDAPRFQWRGVLIDSSRHYLRVSTVLRVLGKRSPRPPPAPYHL